MSAEARRQRVRIVREEARRLQRFEAALAGVQVTVGQMRRDTARMRGRIDSALAGHDPDLEDLATPVGCRGS